MTVKHEKLSGTAALDLGHDPKNQDFNGISPGTQDTTVMTLLMSFKLPI